VTGIEGPDGTAGGTPADGTPVKPAERASDVGSPAGQPIAKSPAGSPGVASPGQFGDSSVPATLRVLAAWSWRLLVVGVVGWFLIQLLARLQFIVIAIFVGLVGSLLGITKVPVADPGIRGLNVNVMGVDPPGGKTVPAGTAVPL